MWTFGLYSNISRLFSTPGYPKHYPNTVVPEFATAVSSKYEVMQMALRANPFRTQYFCWIDAGYFRDLSSMPENATQFSLCLPPNFQTNSVAYQQVAERNVSASIKDIISRNLEWIAGGCFMAELNVMSRWTKEYQVSKNLKHPQR
jgi:Bacterial protein of unknown function (HtrL_YibB)